MPTDNEALFIGVTVAQVMQFSILSETIVLTFDVPHKSENQRRVPRGIPTPCDLHTTMCPSHECYR